MCGGSIGDNLTRIPGGVEMRGGKRAGAGRPIVAEHEKRVQMSLSVSPTTKTRISAMRKDGVQVTAYIEDFVCDLCERWLRGEDL